MSSSFFCLSDQTTGATILPPPLSLDHPLNTYISEERIKSKRKATKPTCHAPHNAKRDKRKTRMHQSVHQPRFFLFAQTRRAHIKRAAPGAGVTQAAGALGEEWRNLREHEKNEFYAQAEAEKKKYEKVKEEYLVNEKCE